VCVKVEGTDRGGRGGRCPCVIRDMMTVLKEDEGG